MQLFSQLSKLFIALLSRKRAAKLRVSERVKACLHTKRTKAVSRSKTPAQRFTIQTKLCVPVALFSPLLSLRGKFGNGATRCARFPCNAAFPTLKHLLCSNSAALALCESKLSPARLHELSLCATSATLGIMQINLLSALVCTSFLRSFSSFAANNNSRSYSAVF